MLLWVSGFVNAGLSEVVGCRPPLGMAEKCCSIQGTGFGDLDRGISIRCQNCVREGHIVCEYLLIAFKLEIQWVIASGLP